MSVVSIISVRSSDGALCATDFDAHKQDLVALFRAQGFSFGEVSRLMDVIVQNREAVAQSVNGMIAAE
jgi:hypothetical protein